MTIPWLTSLAHLVRGALIGIAETIPGVSGGTIALVTGVYETLLSSADHLLRAARLTLATPVGRGGFSFVGAELRQVAWTAILPIGVGMVVALVVAARIIEPLLEAYPEDSRALFGGMILASVSVPLRMVRLSASDVLVFLAAAAAAAVLTSFPPASVSDPLLVLVAIAAAFAVSALVLPGVSGSFLLLTVGLYAPTIAAVNDRDLPYLAVFALGALVGLAVFVKVLRWLFDHWHRRTLVVMAGLMLGSLRALWPWQTDDRALQPPTGDVLTTAVWFAAGVVIVALLVLAESRSRNRPAPNAKSPEGTGEGP